MYDDRGVDDSSDAWWLSRRRDRSTGISLQDRGDFADNACLVDGNRGRGVLWSDGAHHRRSSQCNVDRKSSIHGRPTPDFSHVPKGDQYWGPSISWRLCTQCDCFPGYSRDNWRCRLWARHGACNRGVPWQRTINRHQRLATGSGRRSELLC